jgi:hypothetical protein
MGTAEHVLGHLRAPLGWQQRLSRFTENHDELRALAVHRGGPRAALAAAVVTYCAPGLRFFHDGQLEGRVRHHSMHVGPRPPEQASLEVLSFYRRLLSVLATPEFKMGRCVRVEGCSRRRRCFRRRPQRYRAPLLLHASHTRTSHPPFPVMQVARGRGDALARRKRQLA